MKETKKIYASYYHPSFSWHKLLRKISFTSNNFGDPYTIDLSAGVKVMAFRESYTNLYKHKYWFCYCISSKTQCMTIKSEIDI
jgi:hypothetical protein